MNTPEPSERSPDLSDLSPRAWAMACIDSDRQEMERAIQSAHRGSGPVKGAEFERAIRAKVEPWLEQRTQHAQTLSDQRPGP